MNQILSFGYAGESEKQRKKVIKTFSFFIIIFAIILIIEGIFGYKEAKEKKVYVERPDIDIIRNGDITILKVNSEIGIEKVIYFWNNGIENIVEKDGEQNFELEIETTIGTNDLNLEIIDAEGNSIKYDPVKISYENLPENEEDWQTAILKDKTEPIVSLGAIKGKVTINASDNVRMSYVTYSWNGEEETKITGLSEDEKSLTAEIDALKGDNKLIVKAYDKAGNVATVEKDVHGTDGPEIKVKRENDEIVINIDNQFGITKIYYNFNGEEKTIENINEKTYEIKLQLVDGENYVIVEAYENNVKNEYRGKTTKTPTATNNN
ncbi:MAG: hypothetical protein J6K42_03050 [Clostridia bacterium]|nr:hypothetical protein [Clostridia bacterium]